MVEKDLETGRFIKEYNIDWSFVKQLQSENKTNRQITKIIGCSEPLLSEEMKKQNLISIKRCSVNHNYFTNINNPNACYILGYFCADGCLYTKDGCNSLIFYGEKEILSKIREELQSTHKIGKHDSPNNMCYRLNVISKKMVEDVQKLGITERKSLTIRLPDVPEEHFRHLLRGIIDGDGSYYLNKQDINRSKISIASGSCDFLRDISTRTQKLLKIKSSVYSLRNRNVSYLTWGYKHNIKILFKYLYLEPVDYFYLQRKYEKVKQIITLINEKEGLNDKPIKYKRNSG